MELNKMQQVGVDECCKFIKFPDTRKRPWFEISGPAGSGKTTVVREIIKESGIPMDNVAFMAYVGKATLALRMNGLRAITIHSTIYEIARICVMEDGKPVIKNGRPVMTDVFVKKEKLPNNIELIVLDEGGMVNETMGRDILSFNIPLIVLGDKNQLPPVIGKSIFLDEPDVTLNEIMRQEKDSPIIYLSQLATYGVPIPYGTYGNDECIVIRKNELNNEHLSQADLVICGTNNTRDTINNYIRKKIYNIEDNHIVVGDKLICRQNNWGICLDKDISLVNGMIGYVENVYMESSFGSNMEIDFRPEFETDRMFKKISIEHNYVFSPYHKRKNINTKYTSGVIFEFGYCITCHLSQGSQSNTVLVYVDSIGTSDYSKKWLYTAITRARKKLILVV